jgi:hypothetical protein
LLRQLLIATALAGVLAASAAAQPTVLMPGVTYDRQVVFTPRGPTVIHVLAAPRPGGLYSLRPYLSNDAIPGLEPLTALESRLSTSATLAGVNGDYFSLSGTPNGVLIQGGGLQHLPIRGRSSIGIDAQGNLSVQQLVFFGTWQGSGQRRALTGINQPPGTNGVTLYTPAWGPATPVTPGTVAAVVEPFPPLATGSESAGRVTAVATGGNTPIPSDGAVLVARGVSARYLSAEVPVGQRLSIRPVLQPDWSGVVDGLGGGPLLVRNGKPVFRPLERFSPDQLLPRAARTAVGQKADGSILLVVADGGQSSYSVGLTNFELAETMARLGAVTASALGSGPAAEMAYDGKLLSRPSTANRAEQPLAEALLVGYAGVYAPAPQALVFSPNGDGVDDQQTLSYKVVRPSSVADSLIGPDGVARFSESVSRDPGVYPLAWSGLTAAGTPEAEGTWRWVVTATDNQGQQSSAEQDFTLNNTLGFMKPATATLPAPQPVAKPVATYTLTEPATVTATIQTQGGLIVRTLPTQNLLPGAGTVTWDGRDDSGDPVYTGRYVVSVVAKNQIGLTELTAPLTVRRVAAK